VPARGPRFDAPVRPGGYRWWYVDALSDDARHGLVLIAFVGSAFSPYYARSRRRHGSARADPLEHCAFNVVLYGPASRRWAMTERGRGQVARDATRLAIGPSECRWVGDALRFEIDETCAPIPRRIRGTVTVRPHALLEDTWALDTARGHRWTPIAPRAHVEVALQGEGYVDSNDGDAPLDEAFRSWHWSRATLAGGRAAVLYDTLRADGSRHTIALRFARGRPAEPLDAPPAAIPAAVGRWGVRRVVHGDRDSPPRILRTLEDGPFYARSLLQARWAGEPVTAFHESIDLRRLSAAWVRTLLPFRMPRRRG
jgi:carotenoid 1,2-hydratase